MKEISQTLYLKTGGVRCPNCGSEHIEGNSVQVDRGCAWRELYCNECSASWTDHYKLVGISDVWVE